MSGGPAVNDRGLAYGDGLFETVRVTASGAAPLWPRHRARLLDGAARLRIPVAPDALDAIRELVVQTMEQAVALSVPLVVETGVGANWMEAK